MTDPRYELKFVLDATSLTGAMCWIYRGTRAVRTYPNRHVNSLYFDDVAFSAARDNLIGTCERQKTRLRWYHNGSPEDVTSLGIETKHRTGRLGYKSQCALPMLSDSMMQLEMNALLPRTKTLVKDTEFETRLGEQSLFPSMHVSYLREYYGDPFGLRITLDQDIRFHDVYPQARIFKTTTHRCLYSVLEVKFATELKDHAGILLKHFDLSPQRHSKYLAGLAAFGQAIYC